MQKKPKQQYGSVGKITPSKESVLAEGFSHRSQWKIVTLCSTYDFSTHISVFSLSARVSQWETGRTVTSSDQSSLKKIASGVFVIEIWNVHDLSSIDATHLLPLLPPHPKLASPFLGSMTGRWLCSTPLLHCIPPPHCSNNRTTLWKINAWLCSGATDRSGACVAGKNSWEKLILRPYFF